MHKIIIYRFKDHNLGYVVIRRTYDFYTGKIIEFKNSLGIFNN